MKHVLILKTCTKGEALLIAILYQLIIYLFNLYSHTFSFMFKILYLILQERWFLTFIFHSLQSALLSLKYIPVLYLFLIFNTLPVFPLVCLFLSLFFLLFKLILKAPFAFSFIFLLTALYCLAFPEDLLQVFSFLVSNLFNKLSKFWVIYSFLWFHFHTQCISPLKSLFL